MSIDNNTSPKNGFSQYSAVDETLNAELVKMDKLLENPNCDHRNVLDQAYKIMILLNRKLAITEKNYVLDQEPELWAKVKELKGTYNTWTVLTVTVLSGGLSIAGGFIGIGSAIPGTAMGTGLSNASPKLFSFLSNTAWAQKLSSIGQGVGGAGQGVGAFGKLAGDNEEAKRTFIQFAIEEMKRKGSDRQEAYRQSRDQSHGAINSWQSAAQQGHQTAMRVLEARS